MNLRRFCLVTTFYPPFHFGGDGVYVRRLANALAARGHSVDVLHDVDAYRMLGGRTDDAGYRDHPEVMHHRMEHGALPRLDLLASHQMGRPVAARRRLRSLFDEGGFDVVHFHNLSLVGGPGLLTYGDGVKLCTLHDYWFVCPMHTLWRMGREACEDRTCLRCTLHGRRPPQFWRSRERLRRLSRQVDAFITPSLYSADLHRRHGIEGRIVVRHNFTPAPDPSVLSDRVPGTSRPYFVCVARLEKLKGVQDVIEAFRGFERADLLIAGTGIYERALESQARGLDHVRFLGWREREELDRLVAGAVATVVPSLCYESALPLVAIESFAVGTPVIGRRIGAIAQLGEIGGGWLFEDIEDLRTRLHRVLDSPEEVRAQGREAERRFDELFSEAVHLERYLELVTELCLQRAGRGPVE